MEWLIISLLFLLQRDLQAHINHRHVGDKNDPEPSPHPALAVVKPLPVRKFFNENIVSILFLYPINSFCMNIIVDN